MTSTIDTSRTWRAGVLLFDGFEPLDAIGPAEVLWSLPQAASADEGAGLPEIEVDLVAETGGPVTASYGMVIQPTVSYADCPPLDLLVVPGGGSGAPRSSAWGTQHFRGHEPTLDLVRRQAKSAEVVASVCTGAFILAAPAFSPAAGRPPIGGPAPTWSGRWPSAASRSSWSRLESWTTATS